MRILLSDPAYVDDLLVYLRRCGCSADIVGRALIDASPQEADIDSSYLRMELDAYLHVWCELRAGVTAELLEPVVRGDALT
jgi:hypothetical protein